MNRGRKNRRRTLLRVLSIESVLRVKVSVFSADLSSGGYTVHKDHAISKKWRTLPSTMISSVLLKFFPKNLRTTSVLSVYVTFT